MQLKLSKNISKIIFFGSVWGVLEATLGYLFHFLPGTIAGMLMFPIVNIILIKAYQSTGTRTSLVYMGVVAALIKSVDFLLPGLSVFKTINPMISIIMESMIIAILCPYLVGKNRTKEYASAIAGSIGWRLMYLVYLTTTYMLTGNIGKHIASFQNGFQFLLVNGIFSGLIAIALLWVNDQLGKKKTSEFQLNPVYAVAAFAFAVFVQYLF